jgi:hypothetical protein
MDPLENNIIFCFWTGTNEMSQQRKRCLEQLRNTSECKIQLIDVTNLHDYVPTEQLHKAYPYLSEVHKSDYLRTHFMHFFGGGYCDIKYTTGSWCDAFDQMREDETKVLNGYHEEGPWCVGVADVKPLWQLVPGNGSYIVRKQTEFTKAWYIQQQVLLDERYERLKQHPATHPRSVEKDTPGYPFYWQELLGTIFHTVSSKYTDRFLFTVPAPVVAFSTYA